MLNQLRDPSLLKSTCLLDGMWVAADDATTLDVTNPADGRVIATVPNMGCIETERAIDAASRAFETWKAQPAEARALVLHHWFDLLMANQEDLALIMTMEQGKPLSESQGEIAYAASYVQWFAEEARRTYGSIVPSPWAEKQILVTKEPVGVCAAITPWNFPAAMITRKVAPALAAGCTIIVKPAQETPLTALALAELAVRAGRARRRLQRANRFTACHWWRTHRQHGGAQIDIHRLYGSGPVAGRAMRADAQENFAGTGRECTLHRI